MDRIRTNPPISLHRDERGVALAIALMAIVLIGALVTGTFFAGRLEMGSGRNAVVTAQATEAAETGLTSAFALWNSAWNGYGVGGDSVQAAVYPIGGNTSIRYTNTVRRTQGGIYIVTSRGDRLDVGGNVMASRLLAKLGKLVTANVDIEAAITSKGSPTITGNISISGNNTNPPGWGGCPAAPDVAGVRSDQNISPGGSATVTGNPALKQNDASVVDSTFTAPFATLLPLASIKYLAASGPTLNGLGPAVTGSPSRCDKSNTNNWGAPDHTLVIYLPCQTYFPVVYFANNFGSGNKVHITGGSGEGILLVDGDIQMDGGFQFDGIVIAKGNVSVQGNGTKVSGAILGQSVDAGNNTFSGTSLVNYSYCAIQRALNATAVAVALRERSWVQVNPR